MFSLLLAGPQLSQSHGPGPLDLALGTTGHTGFSTHLGHAVGLHPGSVGKMQEKASLPVEPQWATSHHTWLPCSLTTPGVPIPAAGPTQNSGTV